MKAKAKSKSPIAVGNKVFIRTVTHYLTGKIEEVGTQELVLSDAAWVADTGRFADALKTGTEKLLEVEPFPDGHVAVGRGAIIDCAMWNGDLPRGVK
jgi:hypothetical protein